MARGLRRSDKRIKSPARLLRMKAEYEAAWPAFQSVQIWANVTPALAAELDAERSLYAIRTTKSEVVRQLLEEAIAWRKANRSRKSDACARNSDHTGPGGRLIRRTCLPWPPVAARGDREAVECLADYVIDRHFPDARDAERPRLPLLQAVVERQALLIARWMHVGFIQPRQLEERIRNKTSARLTADDVAEQLPTLAVEHGEHFLADRTEIVGRGVDLDARQQHWQLEVLEVSRLAHDVFAR